MPLTAAAMATAIQTQIAAIPGVNITSTAELSAFCTAIATAIVAQIQSSALVTGTVTSGSGSGGVVTGTVS